jgi:hypothetical protein
VGKLSALIGALALVLVGVVVWAGVRIGSNSGSLTDWTAAIVALVGVPMAAVGLRYNHIARTEQRECDRNAATVQRRAQAEKVSAWSSGAMWRASTPTEFKSGPTQTVTAEGDGPILLEWCDLSILNASDMPVRKFEFEFYVREDGSDDPYTFAGSDGSTDVVMPGRIDYQLMTFGTPLLETMADAMRTIPNNSIRPPQWRVGYAFTDHAGVRWRLDFDTRRVEEVRA